MLPVGVLPHLASFDLAEVNVRDHVVHVVVAAPTLSATCPGCASASDRVHSRYSRTLHDLPIGRRQVVVRVRVRRFRCRNRACQHRIFAERFPGLTGVRARRTHAQQSALTVIGLALGGAPGARLASELALPASRSTLLRLVKAAPLPELPTPRVLGVDDWAMRRGQTYGTILVDLERHQPVDLLPDRTAETFAAWLAEHPGVEVISRDRGGAYADGARQGAPDAVQVADRWHLLKNVGDALERVLARQHADLSEAAAAVDRATAATSADPAIGTLATQTSPIEAPPPPTRVEPAKPAGEARRQARYDAVMERHRQGHSLQAIAREFPMHRRTVRRFVRAGRFPSRASPRPRSTLLDPFESYLRERWTAGCHNAQTLWTELRERGFRGSAVTVRHYLRRWRPTPTRRGRPAAGSTMPLPPPVSPTRVRSARQARWLLLRAAEALEPDDLAYRDQLLTLSPELRDAQTLALAFAQLVRERNPSGLDGWLERAEPSGISEFRALASGLKRDRAAVEAGLRLDWSQGQTEGQVNRLKALKRQMYGRASLDLLRRRFLQAA